MEISNKMGINKALNWLPRKPNECAAADSTTLTTCLCIDPLSDLHTTMSDAYSAISLVDAHKDSERTTILHAKLQGHHTQTTLMPTVGLPCRRNY